MASSSSRLGLRLHRSALRVGAAPHAAVVRNTVGRRAYASTTEATAQAASEAGTKAKTTAQDVASKAGSGLSRVTSSAGPALKGVASGVGNALSRIGGPVGRTVAWVETKIPSAVYYTRVGLELGKIIVRGQKMSPPPIASFQAYGNNLLQLAKNPSAALSSATGTSSLNPNKLLAQARSISGQQLAVAGVVLAELIGFFTVGEMVGRFKVVGYRGDTGHHH